MGIPADEFLRMCPRTFDALVQQHERNNREAEYRHRITDSLLAQITAMVANTGFRRFEDWRQPAEFLPAYAPEPGAKRPRRPTEKQLSANLERTMEKAMRYQAAQVERGIAE